MDEDSLALFDLLAKPGMTKADRERIKQVAGELMAKVRAEVARIYDWRERQATRDAMRSPSMIFFTRMTPACPWITMGRMR